ncbi:MAG TPA: YggS family pyridoxal phosphate-dependent enzyme [Arenimonas sp.]|nr:YggS family pyridoxal phosphate-dependent enzyme [Arenimonas sp.]
MENLSRAFHDIMQGIENAARQAGRPNAVRLLAVSKTRTAAEVRALAALGQTAFGENYVQEAGDKRVALADLDLDLEWHLIGHLQSNKAKDAAEGFDWVQSVDRPRIVEALARHRPPSLPPLNVLIQVNVDDEQSKSGCRPDDVSALAAVIEARKSLRLRGLMAIPHPDPTSERRRNAFRSMKRLFDALAAQYPQVDTLSMGMSEDYALAIAEGATLVRVGSALFGPRGV